MFREFANKSNLNCHVENIYQNLHTKTAYINGTCTEESCTRGAGRDIQSRTESCPFSKLIFDKENEDDGDEDSDTSNTFEASDTFNGSGADLDTSNGSDADVGIHL